MRRRAELGGRVVVISPHLDDAVLSLGAGISWAARHEADVTVLTVLAGDPASTEPAGAWDRRAGFASAGEAARVRRLEDERACELLRAQPVWLPFSDHQYGRGGTDDEIRAAVLEAVAGAHVLLPGFPLAHDDHAWLHRLLDGAFPADRVELYAEQPYAAWSEESRPAGWRPVRAGPIDWQRKLRACRAYRSQLSLLGGGVLAAILRHELRAGGESLALT